MITKPLNWDTLFANPNMKIEYEIYVNETSTRTSSFEVYDNTKIASCNITSKLINDDLEIGVCSARQLELKVLKEQQTIPSSAKLTMYIRLYVDGSNYTSWVKYGQFIVDTREITNLWIVYTAYDRIQLADSKVLAARCSAATSYEFPMTTTDFYDIALTRTGCTSDDNTLSILETLDDTYAMRIYRPTGKTIRNVLEDIATYAGGNFIVDENNKLKLIVIEPDGISRQTITRKTKITTNRPYSAVVQINLTDAEGTLYSAGDTADAGTKLNIESQTGSDDIAEYILSQFGSYQYRPYKADDVLLDPLITLGDTVTIDGVAYVLHSIDATFTQKNCVSNISSPTTTEVNHEIITDDDEIIENAKESTEIRQNGVGGFGRIVFVSQLDFTNNNFSCNVGDIIAVYAN